MARPNWLQCGVKALACLTLMSLVVVVATLAPPMRAAMAAEPKLQVIEGGWGSGGTAEIGKVVAAVAAEFPTNAADGLLPSIRIRHRFGGPKIDYTRDRDGWIVVQLSARDDRCHDPYRLLADYVTHGARLGHRRRGINPDGGCATSDLRP